MTETLTQTSAGESTETRDIATRWLQSFGTAMAAADRSEIRALLRDDCYWRDLVAFKGGVETVRGGDLVADQLADLAGTIRPRGYRISSEFTEPTVQPRGDYEPIEVFIEFETDQAYCKGIVRLLEADDAPSGYRALAVMSAAQVFKGFEPRILDNKPEYLSPPCGGPSWKAAKEQAASYQDHDPEVLVVGGGQAGLMQAAHLQLIGTDVLVIDREDRVGDNWRKRYESLSLHNPLSGNRFPFMGFPDSFPEYLPKDKYATWLESYAENLDLHVWTKTTFEGATFEDGCWAARIRCADGSERVLRPRHVVIATGSAVSRPNIPELPGIEEFDGDVIHSSAFKSPDAYAGKSVIVVGTGTSGHDAMRDLHDAGANVTMVQRGPTTVVSLEGANIVMRPYDDLPHEELDLMFNANDMNTTKRIFQQVTAVTNEMDSELLAGLRAAGFITRPGVDDAGYFWDFFQLGGGYYIDTGASQLIVDGHVKVIQADDIVRFGKDGASLQSGELVEADAIILATGYRNQEDDVRQWFGDEVADRIGQIWGFGDDGEIRNTWRPTAQEGLWFMGGGIPQVRNYSRYVALMIKSRIEGVIPA